MMSCALAISRSKMKKSPGEGMSFTRLPVHNHTFLKTFSRIPSKYFCERYGATGSGPVPSSGCSRVQRFFALVSIAAFIGHLQSIRTNRSHPHTFAAYQTGSPGADPALDR